MAPMQPRGLRFRLLLASAAALAWAPACAWDPWIPGQGSWNPEIVVDPADLSERLLLDAPYVDELDCYARRCQKRFRVIVDEPGQLTLSAIPELVSDDDQARLVLEAPMGVLGQVGSGRGPRTDPPVLSLREPVAAGTYFVLVQSVGSRMPYQLTATLTPGEGPAPRVAEPEPEPPRPEGPPPRLVEVSLPGAAKGGYDPAVAFDRHRTFTFPPPPAPEPGAALETPRDRQIRRFVAEDLERKGLRQATGGQVADLVVDFTLGETTRAYLALPFIYDWYGFGPMGWAYDTLTDTRGILTVDIVDASTQRIAWHAQTTKGLGPGVTYGEKTTAVVREAVAEVLAGFPPR